MNARQYWDNLQPRERRTLLIGGVALVPILLYLAVVDPYVTSLENRRNSVAAQQETLAWMQQAAAEVNQLRRSSPQKASRGNQSLLSLVDSSAKSGGMGESIKRIQPDGSAVQIWLEGVAFDKLISWIDSLSNRYGVELTGLVVEKQPQQGLVNARAVIDEGGV